MALEKPNWSCWSRSLPWPIVRCWCRSTPAVVPPRENSNSDASKARLGASESGHRLLYTCKVSSPPLLDVRNIRVCRGTRIVLDAFNLQVQSGEHVAILGPNGCGKSTLIKTIARECYPVVRTDSSMKILGEESWNIFALRSRLG